MRFVLTGDSDCPIARLALSRGESAKIENGSMVYSRGVEISGGLNAKKKGLGGVLGAIGRSLTSGESMFITTATGTADDGEIAIAPPIPGKIISLEVGGQQQYRLNTGAFLACDSTLDYTMVNQGISKAIFGGTGGLFVMETNGTGTILVSAFGDILTLEVTPESPLVVDNEHVVAWDAGLNYNIQVASGMFGFTTGVYPNPQLAEPRTSDAPLPAHDGGLAGAPDSETKAFRPTRCLHVLAAHLLLTDEEVGSAPCQLWQFDNTGGNVIEQSVGVRHQHHADAVCLRVFDEEAPEARLRGGVEHRGDLIADKVARARHERTGDAAAL